MRFEDRVKATKLRKKGYTYNSILKQIKISKSTLSLWLRDVKLSKLQKKRITQGLDKSRQHASEAKIRRRVFVTKEIISQGRHEFHKLISNPLFLVGLALYWAEGDKNRNERVKFTNSDSLMVQLMMRWFRELCQIPDSKFRIALHIHNLHSNRNAVAYWSKITGVPQNQFYKVYIKQTSLSQRRNVLYNGTCGIVVNSREFFRRIVGWRLGLLDYLHLSP